MTLFGISHPLLGKDNGCMAGMSKVGNSKTIYKKQRLYHPIRNWGHRGYVPPSFQRLGQSALFVQLVVLLENFENAKMNRKIRASSDL